MHCSDTEDSIDIGFIQINRWHAENGWESKVSGISCGYHYIIRRDGKVERGRSDGEVGAHCYGQNRMSLGICIVGRKNFDDRQMKALHKLTRELLEKYRLKTFDVYGHYEYQDNKTCPNLDMNKVRLDIFFKRTEQ